MNNSMLVVILLASTSALGHSRLTAPTPRNNDSGIKNGPCGGLGKTAGTTVRGGQALAMTWQETINHPGKYIISLSTSNDLNFTILKQVPDDQDGGGMHVFNTTVMLPDIDCPGCTLQLVQSMEENPAAPSLYYSCADLNIVKSTSTLPTSPPGSGGATSQSSAAAAPSSTTKFGGCGLVATLGDHHQGPPSGPQRGMLIFALLAPLALALVLKNQARVAARRTVSRNK